MAINPLPDRIAGGYWPNYGSQTLASVSSAYNLLWMFHLTCNTDGTAVWGTPAAESEAQFIIDLQAKRSAGVCCLVTVGGASVSVPLTNRTNSTNFVASVESLYTTFGGFDGLDIDIENNAQVDSTELVWIAQQLKAWQPGFIITVCGFSSGYIPAIQGAAQAMNTAGVLDMVGVECYSFGDTNVTNQIADSKSELTFWAGLVGASKIAFGMELDTTGDTAGAQFASYTTPETIWDWAQTNVAGIRGVFVWNTLLDTGAGGGAGVFVSQVIPYTALPATITTPIPANGGFGMYLPTISSAAITAVETGIGRHLDFLMTYVNWNNGTTAFPTPSSAVLTACGTRPLVWTVQPSSGPFGAVAPNVVNWQNLIAGDYDSELVTFATWVNANVTAAPVIYVRFAHEMNQTGYYDWQVGGSCGVTSGANYAAGFNHVASVLKANSSKIKMVFCPNVGSTNLASFYPNQCDIIAFDGYNNVPANSWVTDSEVFASTYSQCAAVDPNKPIWIGEFASQDVAAFTYNSTTFGPFSGVTKSSWVESFYGSAGYPRLAATTWFNVVKERNWVWNSSTDASNGFIAAFAPFTSSTPSALWNPATGGYYAPSTDTQTGWGGCTFGSAAAPVTSITATFTVPSLSGNGGATNGSLISIWVGMNDILQTGIYCGYDTGKSGNNSTANAPWTWWISGGGPGGSEIWDPSSYPLAAGDVVTLTMAYDNTGWTVTQQNATQSWTYAEHKSFQSVGNAIAAWPYPMNQACVIVEFEEGGAAGVTLPDYGTITFSSITMVPAVNTSLISYVTTANAHVDQTPGTYSAGSFTMTWKAYN